MQIIQEKLSGILDYDATRVILRNLKRGPVNQHEQKEGRAGPAKWVIVVAVLVMLAGIVAYVLSLDEALTPQAGAISVPAAGASVGTP